MADGQAKPVATDPVDFALGSGWDDLPGAVRQQAGLCVLDLLGTGAAGAATPLSAIVRGHAADHFGGARAQPIAFDERASSPTGAALALGMTIDAIDAHDGYNPIKGHIGCGLLPAVLAVGRDTGADGRALLSAVARGYEMGARFGAALHGTVSDYHTSGAWVAPAAAAMAARLLGLTPDQTRHAMGIAEYHGPRSQMMRCIDHPTMLKDGSGWGAMAGVSAAYLAQAGFTGAPAITLDTDDWADLGTRWLILEQYFKPYPVCRWAQAPVEGVLHLARTHGLRAADVDHIEVATFHEAVRLATNDPQTTEEAQYSTSYPCAAALVLGDVTVDAVSPAAFANPEVQRLSLGLRMVEDDACNATFPAQRHARVTLHLRDGRALESPTMSPRWTAEEPPTEAALRDKFHRLAGATLGPDRATALETAVDGLADGETAPLWAALDGAVG